MSDTIVNIAKSDTRMAYRLLAYWPVAARSLHINAHNKPRRPRPTQLPFEEIYRPNHDGERYHKELHPELTSN